MSPLSQLIRYNQLHWFMDVFLFQDNAEAPMLDYPGVQFSTWRPVSNRRDMHSRREPVDADHRLTCTGAQAHDIGPAHCLLGGLNCACPAISCRELLCMGEVARCNADL